MSLYVSFFSDEYILNDMVCSLGLNTDPRIFNSDTESSGGLKYTNFENIHKLTRYGSIIGFITIPQGTPIFKNENGIYKSPQINIEEFMDFDEWLKDYDKHSEEKKLIRDPVLHVRVNSDCSEEIKLAAVKQNGYVIEFIENPSEAVQLAAVKQNGCAIEYIKNPTEAVQLEAVKQKGLYIQYIKDTSEAVQLAAVKQGGSAIQFIEDPSEAIQLEAVNQDGYYILYIKDPSEAVKLAAVKQDGWSIKYIKDPSEAVKLEAVKKNGRAIKYIKNPSILVRIIAFKRFFTYNYYDGY